MLRRSMYSALVLATILAGSHSALAENRVALVIGESAYRSVTPLPNPANDAKAVAKLLADSGFEVTTAADLSREEMNGKVGDFAATIAARARTPLRWCSMPAMACRSTARTSWCR